jgi:hypothetical protein
MMKGVPAAFVTLIIGGIAAGITLRQYYVAKAKLKLDLFDKRYSIFHQTWVLLSQAVVGGTREKNYGLATPFNNFLPEAAFLFGPEISAYLDECTKNWAELSGLQAEKSDAVGTDKQKNIARTSEVENWFFDQASKGAKAKFGKYLNFENWK